jgi:hypothetical protein
MAWAEVGQTALFFHNGGAGECCIQNYWYQVYAGEWWAMSHAEPYLLRSFAGRPERLADRLAGHGTDVSTPLALLLELPAAEVLGHRAAAGVSLADEEQPDPRGREELLARLAVQSLEGRLLAQGLPAVGMAAPLLVHLLLDR